jgi:hypothetical protein
MESWNRRNTLGSNTEKIVHIEVPVMVIKKKKLLTLKENILFSPDFSEEIKAFQKMLNLQNF